MAASGDLTFAPGDTSQSVAITILDDATLNEGDEKFTAVLTAVAGAAVGSPQTVVHADGLSVPAIVDGLRCGRSYLARSRDVALELTASTDDGVAGPGQTLRVRHGASVMVTAVISGAPGANVALITAAGRVQRATVGASARLQWELDTTSARFARLEIREAQRRPLGAMVALTNPVWLA